MKMNRSWLGVGFLVSSLGAGVLVACGNDTPPDVPTYGPPNAIGDKNPAPPSGVDAAPAPTATTPAGGEAGAVTSFACGTAVDGGTCTKSWKTDIFPKMTSTGPWKCATTGSCHGPGAIPPAIDETSAHATYLTLTGYKFPGDTKYYVDPCSTDPTASTFSCNTLGTGACGASMPQANTAVGPTPTTAADQADILTWVKCGAPEN